MNLTCKKLNLSFDFWNYCTFFWHVKYVHVFLMYQLVLKIFTHFHEFFLLFFLTFRWLIIKKKGMRKISYKIYKLLHLIVTKNCANVITEIEKFPEFKNYISIHCLFIYLFFICLFSRKSRIYETIFRSLWRTRYLLK